MGIGMYMYMGIGDGGRDTCVCAEVVIGDIGYARRVRPRAVEVSSEWSNGFPVRSDLSFCATCGRSFGGERGGLILRFDWQKGVCEPRGRSGQVSLLNVAWLKG